MSEEHLLNVLKLDPYHPKTHYELGLLYQAMLNSEKAIEHIKKAIDIWKNADKEYNIAQHANTILKELQNN